VKKREKVIEDAEKESIIEERGKIERWGMAYRSGRDRWRWEWNRIDPSFWMQKSVASSTKNPERKLMQGLNAPNSRERERKREIEPKTRVFFFLARS